MDNSLSDYKRRDRDNDGSSIDNEGSGSRETACKKCSK
jgi:hypothetical protein